MPARVVDHVVPVKDGGARYLANNLQALCVSCHNRKTARESAGRRVPPGGVNLYGWGAQMRSPAQIFPRAN